MLRVRIAVLTTWFPTERSPGAGSFIARDVVALAHDHDVEVIHLVAPELDDGQRTVAREGVTVRRIPLDVRRPRQALVARREVARALAARPVDLIHTMAAPALLPFLIRRPVEPWVHTEHWSGVVNLAKGGRSMIARPLVRRGFAGPDVVVAVSDFLADSVRVLRKGPVQVIGNIVDAPEGPATMLRPVPVASPRELRLLGVGTVNEHKGWRLAVDALGTLARTGFDVRLTWLGDGPELEELRRVGTSLGVDAPGHQSVERVRAEMARADVFILPTRSETFSLATVEALAAGLPVVATGVGAHTGFLTPETGVVVSRDAEALAAGISSAAALDKDVVRARGRLLIDRFSEARSRDAYRAVYEKVTRA